MNDHVHSHLVPCPACGTRFTHVLRCPICMATHSSYPHWVAIKVKDEEEGSVSSQVKFCCKTCAEQGTGQNLNFEWQKSGEYICQTEVTMARERYDILMARLNAVESVFFQKA